MFPFVDLRRDTSDDAAPYERVTLLRGQGAKPKYHHLAVGGNDRLDALQAALLRVKLPKLGAALEQRQCSADCYTQLFLKADIAYRPPEGRGCLVESQSADAPLTLPAGCQELTPTSSMCC
jgi:dTDP-4-amino-4,6-dideoxygalactose transaminase